MRKALVLIGLGVSIHLSAQELPEFTEAKRLSENINGKGEEAKVVLSSDGRIMYFVRAFDSQNVGFAEHPENEDIWESVKDENGAWKAAEHETTINDVKNNSIIGQGKENHYFLLNTYQDKKSLQYGIALTRKRAEHDWSEPEVISIPKLKYQGNFYDFYITHDEKVLLISIKGEDSKGEEDLYVSLNNENKWGEPINLGDQINSAGYEMSPFLTEDKKRLFFSSKGRSDGLGDADIYVSERLDDTWTNWSTPQNVGAPINSSAMDCYFTMSDNGEYYFSSNRVEGAGLDIYQAIVFIPPPPPEPVVNGLVLNSKDSSALSVKLSFANYATKEKVGEAMETAADGKFQVQLARGVNYSIHAEKEGFYAISDNVDLTNAALGDTIEETIFLSPIEVGEVIRLENIFFDFDKSELREESHEELNKLVKMLNDYPTMQIEIAGHTDNKGNDDYNLKLSDERVKSVVEYVHKQGISGKQVYAKGYGESNPIADNETEEGRQINRRVEFKILKK